MEQSREESNSRLGGEKLFTFYMDPKVHCSTHKIQTLDPTLIEKSLASTFTPHFVNVHFNIIIH
jgi:hypothetical protein